MSDELQEITNKALETLSNKALETLSTAFRASSMRIKDQSATIEKLKGLVTDYFESMSETSNGHDFSVAKEALIKAIKAGES